MLQTMGSQRVGHDLVTTKYAICKFLSLFFIVSAPKEKNINKFVSSLSQQEQTILNIGLKINQYFLFSL